MTMSHDTNELIVVSGASTGMGAATARELALRGYQVLAGVRRESDGDPLRTARIEPTARPSRFAADGHWGVPTMVFAGEPFFGQGSPRSPRLAHGQHGLRRRSA